MNEGPSPFIMLHLHNSTIFFVFLIFKSLSYAIYQVFLLLSKKKVFLFLLTRTSEPVFLESCREVNVIEVLLPSC